MLNWTVFAIGAVILVGIVAFVSPGVHTRSRIKRRSPWGCLIFCTVLVGLVLLLSRYVDLSHLMLRIAPG